MASPSELKPLAWRIEWQKRKLLPCDGWKESSCCNAPIKWGDICTECGEHCDIMCVDCDAVDHCEKGA